MANHTDLKKFAQSARRSLREQVAARLDQVLHIDSAALREREAARRELTQQIAETSKKAVIDRVAYTWFNRSCALRFMDANRYNRIGVVSPAEGFTQPEILQEAKGGYIDRDLQAFVDCPAVFDLLGGRRPSADPQQEAYRMLLVGACNALNRAMPFLFEPIADYTELLMPQDLLSEHSILHNLREALTPEACQDVEVIGWLYQFYISERKDEVFEALKQNQKIAPEDIPAATQLFTPHWIVRYLVENSLGRLWMLNHPQSRLTEKMEYYIRPEQEETDFLRITSPEEIKICDPACGSGHMLTYAFDLLYAIYEEEGYPAADIPRLILEKNLYGIEIDERAGNLAAFVLVMKARGKDRRFFSREVQPNICVLENISFTDQELNEYVAAVGNNIFTEPLLITLKQYSNAENFGSLIRPSIGSTDFIKHELSRKELTSNLFLFDTHLKVEKALSQSSYLSQRYHVVVANPPYMGSKGMNQEVRDFALAEYPESKSDLYSMFIERNLSLVIPNGLVGMITMQSWMFLGSFEALRKLIASRSTILSMAHFGPRAFDSISGEVVSTTAFVIENHRNDCYRGSYLRLVDGNSEGEKNILLKQNIPLIEKTNPNRYYRSSISDFRKIPGWPIAYWVSERVREIFQTGLPLRSLASPRQGMATTNNDLFLRYWFETEKSKIGFGLSREEAVTSGYKWFPINKGGPARKWYGNHDFIVNYENEGKTICDYIDNTPGVRVKSNGRVINRESYFKEGITWSTISSEAFAMRYSPQGRIFETKGATCFCEDRIDLFSILGYLNTKIVDRMLQATSPTLDFHEGPVGELPIIKSDRIHNINTVNRVLKAISLARADWDDFETSNDFKHSALISNNSSIKTSYLSMREQWHKRVVELQELEEENNRIFIEAYGLQEELEYSVPLDQVTLTCNPHYRYGGNRSDAELEALLLADTMREFISYAVGCMFGRYSLDKPGLILANQGETQEDYLRQVPDPTFLPDEDNTIPVLDGEWFSDDVCERFKKFLKVTFGEQHYEENLAFIENAIGRDIRSYFLKEFYGQHVKMYQKRPIYWMFSSPRGSFNVLIYMHRYQPDTISVILNRYLREFRGKLEGRKAHLEQVSISASSTPREKTAALKEIEGLNKTLEEIRVYERDILYPLAVQGIQIDLDDGVKVNYQKFGKALAKVSGLSEG